MTENIKKENITNEDEASSPKRLFAEGRGRYLSLIHISEPTRPY